jgi:hypothetical protein
MTMEILADPSIPEPGRQVPLQQQLIERSASRPMDPQVQQDFVRMQQRGRAHHNAQLLATRQQVVLTNPPEPNRTRNSRSNSGRRGGRGRGNRNRRNAAPRSHSHVAPPLDTRMDTVEETARNNQATVNAWNNSHRPDGTEAAYAPKEIEYFDFCRAVYGPQLFRRHGVNEITALPPEGSAALYTVTPEKCLAFCFYQGHREKRPSNQEARFDVADYIRVHDLFDRGQLLPPNPIGAAQLRGYSGAVLSVWRNQKAQNANSFSWSDDINGRDLQDLMKMVRNRKPMVDHANAAEKITSEILPFMYRDYLLDIEKHMWSRAVNANARAVFAALRDGYTMKQTTQAILRGESLEKADLSDCFDLKIQTEEDHHPLHIDVLQVATGKGLLQSYPIFFSVTQLSRLLCFAHLSVCPVGKTNKDRKIYGRAMRHKNLHLCAIGAKAMYLYYRFNHTKEFENPPDFTDNAAWFFIKLLVPSDIQLGVNATGIRENEISMSIRTYAEAMKKVLKALNLPPSWQAHFGRKVGAMILELQEVPKSVIDALGNWAMTQQEQSYSAWLPFLALRVVAGFKKHRSSVFCKRSTKPGSAVGDRLKALVFKWLPDCIRKVEQAITSGKGCFTALLFLRHLENLAEVLLQDMAVRMNEPDREPHPLYTETLFASDDFTLYREEMALHMDTAPDPVDMSMEAALPGVNARFEGLNQSVADLGSKIDAMHTDQRSNHDQVIARNNELHNGLYSGLAGLCSAVQPTNSIDQARSLVPLVAANSLGFAQLIHRVAIANPSAGIRVDNPELLEQLLAQANSSILLPVSDHTVAARVQAAGAAEAVTGRLNDVDNAVLATNHESVTNLYSEWFGIGPKQDQPCPGGFEALEVERRSFWRKGYSKAENQRFSKLKRVIECIKKRQERGGTELLGILAEYDGWWKEVGSNPTNMIELLRSKQHYVAASRKGKKRGREEDHSITSLI